MKINPDRVAYECSREHIRNVLIDLIQRVESCEALAKEVLSLNEKSGEIGEGKCLNMKSLAEKVLK
jgi:hypothetical protein